MITDAEAARMVGLQNLSFPSWTQGVLITDSHLPDNPIIYANAGFVKLTGYEIEEILDRNCRFLQGPGTDPHIVSMIRHAIAHHQIFGGEILNYRKDGTAFLNHLAIGPIRGLEAGRYFVGLQLEVTPPSHGGADVGA